MKKASKKVQKTKVLERMIGRFMTLLSGTLVTTAGTCIGSMSFLLGKDTKTVDKALKYDGIMLLGFVLLAVVFYEKKKSLDAAAADESKKGLLEMSSAELLALAMNEGISNLTGAMASIMAQVNYGFFPHDHGSAAILWTFTLGCAILIIGEVIQRSLKKGSMAEYVVSMLNGLNSGSVAWWFGISLSNSTQNMFGAPDYASPKVEYWMWLASLVFGLAVMEFVHLISHSCCKGPTDKPYGSVLFGMLKGVPMYSSGFILNNVVQDRWGPHHYLGGTLLWIAISAAVVIQFDQFVHMPNSSWASGSCYAKTDKDVYALATAFVSLVGQIFAFVCGQLAGFALADWLVSASDFRWFFLGFVFQVFGFLVEDARHRWLPTFFKDVQEDYRKVNMYGQLEPI